MDKPFFDYSGLDEKYPEFLANINANNEPDNLKEDNHDFTDEAPNKPEDSYNGDEFFDYENEQYKDIYISSKELPFIYVVKGNQDYSADSMEDFHRINDAYYDFTHDIRSIEFPQSLSVLKSDYGTVRSPVSTFGGKGRVVPMLLFAMNYIVQHNAGAPGSAEVNKFLDCFGGSGVLTLNAMHFKDLLGLDYFHFNDLEPGLSSVFTVLKSESLSNELVDLLKNFSPRLNDPSSSIETTNKNHRDYIPFFETRLYKTYSENQEELNGLYREEQRKLRMQENDDNKKNKNTDSDEPKEVDLYLNRGTFKAARAFCTHAPYNADTFFSVFRSLHSPIKGKYTFDTETGRETYKMCDTVTELLSFCRTMALLYNKTYDEDLFKKLVSRWYACYATNQLIQYPLIITKKTRSRSKSKAERSIGLNSTDPVLTSTDSDPIPKKPVQPRFIESLKHPCSNHKSLAVRRAAAEYISLMASNNNSRANFNNDMASRAHFEEAYIERILTASKLVRSIEHSEDFVVSNMDAFDMLTLADDSSIKVIDPPYFHSTRNVNACNMYVSELTDPEHETLASILANSKHWILCGYAPSDDKNNPYAVFDDDPDVLHIKYMTFNFSGKKGRKPKSDDKSKEASDSAADVKVTLSSIYSPDNSQNRKPIAYEHLWIHL